MTVSCRGKRREWRGQGRADRRITSRRVVYPKRARDSEELARKFLASVALRRAPFGDGVGARELFLRGPQVVCDRSHADSEFPIHRR